MPRQPPPEFHSRAPGPVILSTRAVRYDWAERGITQATAGDGSP